MTESGPVEERRPGILDAYCAELQRLATTLCDLLDVAERRTDLSALDDLDAVLALEPAVGRLWNGLARVRRRTAGESPPEDPGIRPIDERAIADLCRSAVQTTVLEMLEGRDGPWSEDLRALLSAITGDENGIVDGDCPLPESETADGEPFRLEVESVPPERTLTALLEDVGRWASLHGTASTMPIAGLFTMLSTAHKTGCLHLRLPDEHLRFVFADGAVVATATTLSAPDQLLGEILVARNALAPARRQELLALARTRQRPLGAVAVAEGDVTVEDLTSALSEQVQARFDRVFQDASTAYAFVATERHDMDGRIRLNARELLFEGALRADRLKHPRPV